MVAKRRALELVIDIIGEILAFFAVLLILFMLIHGAFFTFLNGTETLRILTIVREVLIITVVGLKGMEFALKKSWILSIIFGVLLAAVVVFMFFPGALPYNWFVNGNGAAA